LEEEDPVFRPSVSGGLATAQACCFGIDRKPPGRYYQPLYSSSAATGNDRVYPDLQPE